MKRIRNFVKNTFKNYPKDERDALIESITEMLIEKVEDLIDKGCTEQEAIDKAVIEFGTLEDYEMHAKKTNLKQKFQKSLKHYKNDMLFSLLGTIITIVMLVYINLSLASPTVLWFVIPALAMLWWPLATFYRYINKKETSKGEKDE